MPRNGQTLPIRPGLVGHRALRWIAAGLLLACLSLTSCVSVIDGESGLPPFVGVSETESGESYWVVRPFVGREKQEERSDFYALWPIGRHSTRGDSTQSWILPLWFQAHYRPEPVGSSPQTDDSDGFIFPLFFYGDDPVDGRYFLFFPIAGWVRGLLGMDRIDILTFPLFARLTQGDRVSKHVLFPFINWVDGPRDDGWRIWPFYGHYTAHTLDGEKKYDRRYYMWPFVLQYDNNLDTERPVSIRWVWPFYGEINATTFVERTILWPLVSWRSARDEPDFRLNITPLFTWRHSEIHRQTDLWPLIGFREQPGYYRHFFLFPIHRYEHTEYEGWVKDSTWILPLYWHHRSVAPDQSLEERTHLWPLASSRTRLDGTWEFSAFDLLPFEDDGGFHLLYRRLWQVVRCVEEPKHRRSAWEFAWGIVSHEETPSRSRFSVLGGLFGTETDHGRSRVRILWIPFG